MKNTIQYILIGFILYCFGILYATADYSNPYEKPPNIYDSIFYIVESTVFVLFSLYGIVSNSIKIFKYSWIILAAFFLIRWVWEIKAAIYGLNINEKVAVLILFIVDSGAVVLVTYLPFLIGKRKWLQ